MLNSKKVRDMMVPVADYPHILNNASVRDAFFVLKKNFEDGKGYRSILVVDKEHQLKGMLSMNDLIRAVEPAFLKKQPSAYQGLSVEYPALTVIWQELFSSQCKKEAKKEVKGIMTPIKATVTLDDPIAKVAYYMITAGVPVIPVIDNDKVVGVVRLVDVFNEIANIVLEA